MEGKCNAKKEHRACPYCDAEIAEAAFPYCEACQVQLTFCPKCQRPVARDAQICPHCGAKIKARR